MKSLLPYFRMKRIDREIIELINSGVDMKKVAKRLKVPYKLVKQKVEKFRRLGINI